jgi:hypothetical protein
MSDTRQTLDYTALKFNQLSIMTLVVLGFILNQPLLLAFVALVLIAGTISNRFALFKLMYRYIIKPAKLMKSHLVEDRPAPHNFAQFLGGIVLGLGFLFLESGENILGWSLAWGVILLAAANFFFGFCAGCFIYYQLGKFGVPGFRPSTQ